MNKKMRGIHQRGKLRITHITVVWLVIRDLIPEGFKCVFKKNEHRTLQLVVASWD